jgi:hypothetical protein
MCPFCIGAATWAAAGVISAGGLGVLATVATRQRRVDDAGDAAPDRSRDATTDQPPGGRGG